jgi:hypothetical protein
MEEKSPKLVDEYISAGAGVNASYCFWNTVWEYIFKQ